MRIRVVPTASGKKALQVVSKHDGKVTIHKHIGTFSDETEKAQLLIQAQEFIQKTTGQTSLLDLLSSIRPSDITITESRPLLLYQLLSSVYDKLGLNSFSDPVIKDLVIARIYSPTSKKETQEILINLFGRHYSLKTVYRHLREGIDKGLKDSFQKALISFARDGLGDNLRLVFYDVTTLYFESSVRDGLKDFGFSKDHRPLETQVLVGLVVNKDGFPLYFDIFQGNTFEGHTFLPVIEHIRELLGTNKLIVIADSAMISQENIKQLSGKGIGFVVGARVANLPTHMISTICQELAAQDGKIITTTYRGHKLLCEYSAKRATKDKSDRLKQVDKAKVAISSPQVVTNRFRFVKQNKHELSLNEELIAKAEKLEGIKGYLTNTNLPEKLVIDRYHDLWRVENSFRLTKSDLEARPIFHHLDETIKAHLVIVFAALAISRYIEIQTNMSIQRVLKLSEKVLTHKVTNIKTGEIGYIETTIDDPLLKEKIELLKSLGH